MTQTTKTERLLDEAMARYAGDSERVTALERARKFKRCWIDLAEVLVRVRERVAETVADGGDVDDEIRHLIQALSA